ncbi:MAG: hypothetical protein JNM00_03495 [Flavobacteriales bacterium]|nr:hypothetical protein [Flavobacteriales bacterium]
MALKKRLIADPLVRAETQLEIGNSVFDAGLFDPTTTISDDLSTTVLTPQRILGFHKRRLILEKVKDIDGPVRRDFEIPVPANTTSTLAMIEGVALTYGHLDVLGNLQEPAIILRPRREMLSDFIISSSIRHLGPVVPFNGGPQLVRMAILRIVLLLGSDGVGTWGGFVNTNVLFIGE